VWACLISFVPVSFVLLLAGYVYEDQTIHNRYCILLFATADVACHNEKEHRLVAFGSRIARRVFRPKTEGVKEGWTKWHYGRGHVVFTAC
jgi:hypothetical protein